MFECLKPLADTIIGPFDGIEKWFDPDCTCLEGFTRSLQLDDYSCGAQCAFMILRFFGKARSIQNVTRQLGTDTDGTSQYQIKGLLERRGLRVKRIRAPKLKHLREAIDDNRPVLVSMDTDHWAVVCGYSRGAIYIADPSLLPLLSAGAQSKTSAAVGTSGQWLSGLASEGIRDGSRVAAPKPGDVARYKPSTTRFL